MTQAQALQSEPQSPPEKSYTLHEAAEAVGVCYMTIWRHIKRGDLPATRRGSNGPWRIKESELFDWNGGR